MGDKDTVRRLYRLAERISVNAETVRNASKPWHLTIAKSRSLRHLKELNLLRDVWSDTYMPTRRKKFPPQPCSCDRRSHWANHWANTKKAHYDFLEKARQSKKALA